MAFRGVTGEVRRWVKGFSQFILITKILMAESGGEIASWRKSFGSTRSSTFVNDCDNAALSSAQAGRGNGHLT